MMSPHKRAFSFLFIVAFAFLLSGCSGNGNEKEMANGEQTDSKVKQSINEAADQVSSAIQNAAGKLSNSLRSQGERLETEVAASLSELPDGAKLTMDNQIGNIEIKPSANGSLNAKAMISTQNKKASADERKAILEQAVLSLTTTGDEITIMVHSQDDPARDLWSWAERQYGFSDFNIDYVIEAPQSIGSYTLASHVGDIKLDGLDGELKLHNNVGNIETSSVRVSGNSALYTDTGDILLGLSALQEDSSLEVKNQIGSVRVNLAKDVNCDLNLNAEVGSVSGASKGKSQINGGGPKLSVSAQVGSIAVTQS